MVLIASILALCSIAENFISAKEAPETPSGIKALASTFGTFGRSTIKHVLEASALLIDDATSEKFVMLSAAIPAFMKEFELNITRHILSYPSVIPLCRPFDRQAAMSGGFQVFGLKGHQPVECVHPNRYFRSIHALDGSLGIWINLDYYLLHWLERMLALPVRMVHHCSSSAPEIRRGARTRNRKPRDELGVENEKLSCFSIRRQIMPTQ